MHTAQPKHQQMLGGSWGQLTFAWLQLGGQTLKLSSRTVGFLVLEPMESLSPGGDNFWVQREQSGYKESLRPLKAVGLPVLRKEIIPVPTIPFPEVGSVMWSLWKQTFSRNQAHQPHRTMLGIQHTHEPGLGAAFNVLYLRHWRQWRGRKESSQIHSPQGLQSTEWDPGSSESTVFGGKKQMLFLLLA